jgi:hypothetical protein
VECYHQQCQPQQEQLQPSATYAAYGVACSDLTSTRQQLHAGNALQGQLLGAARGCSSCLPLHTLHLQLPRISAYCAAAAAAASLLFSRASSHLVTLGVPAPSATLPETPFPSCRPTPTIYHFPCQLAGPSLILRPCFVCGCHPLSLTPLPHPAPLAPPPTHPPPRPLPPTHPQMVDLFRTYFQGALNESSVKRNFVLIYELLDECMDFGFPQLTEPAALKNFIMEKGVRSEVDAVRREGGKGGQGRWRRGVGGSGMGGGRKVRTGWGWCSHTGNGPWSAGQHPPACHGSYVRCQQHSLFSSLAVPHVVRYSSARCRIPLQHATRTTT